ncbi:TolB family protein [Cryptosporangium sp. NPDC051539]|uniref:TolB family protein n=1 Tax=Cryptosporangium sp. NPDC051539 TaxID=3363962 RepID=UPI0037AC8E96
MRWRPLFVVLVLASVGVLASAGLGVGAAFAVKGDSGGSRYPGPRYPTDTENLPLWTSDVTESAPGRSVFLLETIGVFSSSHVVFSADSDRVRGVDSISGRTDQDYGVVTMQLAPDGSRLAVGDATGDGTDVLVADLTTGSERRFPIEAGPAGLIEVLAWSADARQLAVAAGSLYVLDVESGRFTKVGSPDAASPEKSELLPGEQPLPGGAEPPALSSGSPGSYDEPGGVQAAFSPDGRSIVFDDGSDIEVYPADGSGSPVLLTDRTVRLAGPNAWSPDGARVLVLRDEATAYDGTTSLLAIDVASKQAERLARFGLVEFSEPVPVGWRSADEVLLAGTDENGTEIVDAYRLDGQRRSRVLTLGYSSFSAVFAAKLLVEATPRGGGFTGGPTPMGWRVAIGLVTALVAALVLSVVGTAVGVPLALHRRAAARRTVVPPLPYGRPVYAAPPAPARWRPPPAGPPPVDVFTGGAAEPGETAAGVPAAEPRPVAAAGDWALPR